MNKDITSFYVFSSDNVDDFDIAVHVFLLLATKKF